MDNLKWLNDEIVKTNPINFLSKRVRSKIKILWSARVGLIAQNFSGGNLRGVGQKWEIRGVFLLNIFSKLLRERVILNKFI